MSLLRDEHAALLACVGPLKAMLDRVVLDDAEPGRGEMPGLLEALDRLAVWFDVER